MKSLMQVVVLAIVSFVLAIPLMAGGVWIIVKVLQAMGVL